MRRKEILKRCLSPPVFVSSDGWMCEGDPQVWKTQERRVFVIKSGVSLSLLGVRQQDPSKKSVALQTKYH